jgi:PhoPQ-activated pathogenicity-related protein
MMTRIPLQLSRLWVGLAAALFLSAAIAQAQPRELALDRYVAEPDAAYKYEAVAETSGRGFQQHVIKMTSQRWLTEEEVNQPEWWHWINIIIPTEVKHETALLFIGGGSNNDLPSDGVDEQFRQIADATGAIVAELRMVPNQPLVFKGDGKPRSEDELIAYGWDKYLKTQDPKWLPRLPMTKAAVRAMDTVSDFCGKKGQPVKDFVVAGGSKRGWTTWTTAAVDKRVIAISPMVIDALNLEPSMIHHYKAYGAWAEAIGDYEREGNMDWLGSEEFRALLREVDPYEFRERFTMPKYLINASGDQFFLPDSSKFYFDDLPGEKHLRYVPNADHSLKGTDAVLGFIAWFKAILNKTPRPTIEWEFREDGRMLVTPSGRPLMVTVWQATNRQARDFRFDKYALSWMTKAFPITAESHTYTIDADAPAAGWVAYFVEITYKNGMKFSTPIRVVPDTLPHGAPPTKE